MANFTLRINQIVALMKKILTLSMIGFIFIQVGLYDVYGQGRLIRRMQQEMERKVIEELFGEEEKKEEVSGAEESDRSTTRNRRGSGLTQEIPDVNLHIAEARDAFSNSRYTSAKSSLRQALWGVELEIGQQVLASLPETVSGLHFEQANDRVSSTGIGFVGLIIERKYSGGDDVELNLSVGNDSGLFGLAHAAVASGLYINSTDDVNHKQVRFQDHTAYIQYDDYDGYMLSVPFGQSSLFLLQGVNFDDEASFMAAAGQFDIPTIKQKLGEQ